MRATPVQVSDTTSCFFRGLKFQKLGRSVKFAGIQQVQRDLMSTSTSMLLPSMRNTTFVCGFLCDVLKFNHNVGFLVEKSFCIAFSPDRGLPTASDGARAAARARARTGFITQTIREGSWNEEIK